MENELDTYRTVRNLLAGTISAPHFGRGDRTLQWRTSYDNQSSLLMIDMNGLESPIAIVKRKNSGRWIVSVSLMPTHSEPNREYAKRKAGELLCQPTESTHHIINAISELPPEMKNDVIEWYIGIGGIACFSSGEIIWLKTSRQSGAISESLNLYTIYSARLTNTFNIETDDIKSYLRAITLSNVITL